MTNPLAFGRVKYLQADTNLHTAWALRPGIYGKRAGGVGVAAYQDVLVMQRQAGANMTVDVGATGVGQMEAWVPGTSRTGQGLYSVTNIDWTAPTTSSYVAQLNVTVGANASGNPRIDMVVLEVLDSQHAGASAVQQVRVVAGTPTGGATLDNRTGAAAQPANSILLADVVVANGASSIVTANIRDRRPFALSGAIPVPLTVIDQVAFYSGITPSISSTSADTSMDLTQCAVLMNLPRRIVGATRIRWSYLQSNATALTGNYNIGICDSSGRPIVTTGSVALTGASSSVQNRAETISATTFEAGSYYVWMGLDTTPGGSAIYYQGVKPLVSAAVNTASYPNVVLVSTTGGITAPATILGYTDFANAVAASTNIVPVPAIALSVG
jgi:hypothetical protein